MRKRLNYFKYSVGLLVLQKNIVLLITVTAIFSSLLGPALSFDFAFATSEEEEEREGEDNDDGGDDDDRGCDLSYPEDCIPSPPPDLDCGDNGVPNNVKVLPPDPHRLDGNKGGVGCEGSSRGSRDGGGSSSDGDNGNNDGGNNDGSSTSTDECQGQADCFRGTVTEIVDGDTMDINNLRVICEYALR